MKKRAFPKRAFVRYQNAYLGLPQFDLDTLNAVQGLHALGIPMAPYEYDPFDGWPASDLTRDDLVVGDVHSCHAALRFLGIDPPAPFDYPDPLFPYLGRKVERTTMSAAFDGPFPAFIKPAASAKAFTGCVVRKRSDFDRFMQFFADETPYPIWRSEVVDFVTEWRCFVNIKQSGGDPEQALVGAKPYRGFLKAPKWTTVENAILEWYDAGQGLVAGCPAAFALDFGVTRDGRTLLVEANDFYALGSYDLESVVYAEGLIARWRELVHYNKRHLYT